MTQFTVRHDVFESNSSDGTRVVATKAVVQSSNLTSGTQFRAQRTLKELFMTITFHSEGGTSEYDSIEALVGDKVAELPDASNGTYLFDGWYTSAVGGTKVTTDTIVSSTIEHLYAHWIAATTLTFNSNGGTISGSTTINAYVGYPLSIKGSTFPTATGPSDTPNFIGFYTSASGGSKITSETVYDGSYTTLYAHYISANWTSKFTCTPSSTYPKVGIYSATRYSSSNPIYIDWGDGETQEVNGNISQVVHEYKTFGTYQVKISDNISSFALSYNNSTWYQTTTNNYYNVISLDTFSSKITSMPTYCFYQLNALRSAIWPSNCTSIPNYAFYYCQSSYFKQFVVPQGVTSIGSYAFAYCRYLSDITLPTSLRTLNSYCFEYCWYYGNQKTSIVIPEGVTSIPSYCFYYCYYLNDITLPSTVTSIGTYAFSYCWYYSGSVGITIPNGVTSLPNRCFYYCRYLPSITMPDTLTSIGAYCFYYCYYNLKSISIPKKCSSIGDYCFYYCYYLKDITIPRTTAPTLGGTNVFGTSTSYYTGRATYSAGTNTLHVLKNASGYDAGIWTQYLLNSSCCGYHISEEDMGYEKKAVEFNANGGTGGGTRDVYVGFEFGKIGIQAVGPTEHPTLMGWFTQPEGGDPITSDTVYDGTYTILYAHYGNASYSVDLKSQWFKDDGSGVDPKGNAYALQYTTNPDTSLYDGTYVSYGNWHVNNGYSVMRINLVGYDEFTIYIRSYAESNYDYTIAGNIDQAITSGSPSTYKARTYGNQQSGTAIGSYTKVTYTGLGGGNHFIDVCYRKDSSVDSNQDRGYVLIDNPIPPHPVTITFETNGGSEIAPIQMMSGNKITKPTDPTKTDWYFGGWYSDSGLTQSWNFDTVVYDDVTLYAKWRDTDLPYDAEVEYLESSGIQYINTNVLAYEDLVCKIKNLTALRYATWCGFVGLDDSNNGSNKRRWVFRFGGTSTSIGILTGAYSDSEGGTFLNFYIPYSVNTTLDEVTVKRTWIECDGRETYTGNILREYEVSSYPIFLFGLNQTGNIWRGCHCRIGGAMFKREDVTVADFIAVRFTNENGVSEGAMYDRVSGQLFRNSGTGSFVIGPDKNS